MRIQGGVSVGIFIFSGGAYVFIQLDGRMRIVNVDDSGFVTFDQVAWLIKANGGSIFAPIEQKYWLSAGFGKLYDQFPPPS